MSAKELSEAFADTPQRDELIIRFHFYEPLDRRGKPQSVLSLHYVGEENIRVEAPVNPKWSISVAPVARSSRHLVNELLKKEALPAMRNWLIERKNLHSRFGGQSLSAVFDEHTETLRMEHYQTPGETFST
ncbi:MAG: hypothetical protein WA655_23120 [Candidatus Korobacteraceae bacterium]